ncbi:MAG: triphosphoribosyl-dephospho-CoA synthase [Archaeoglobaceae archaeon]
MIAINEVLMFKDACGAAESAVFSMLLEVSANPKSGNVDRGHDFPDMRYEHFLFSALKSYPVFLKAARREQNIGELILEAVRRSSSQTGKNIHFGSFLLLVPLVYSWEGGSQEIASKAISSIKNTDWEGSLAVLEAYDLLGARVMSAHQLSLKNKNTEKVLREERLSLYQWMDRAPPKNIIAQELTNGYKHSLRGSRLLRDFMEEENDVNSAVVLTYHKLLSELPDPLIISKHGEEVAEEVMEKARQAMEERRFKVLDEELVSREINPGTIADLTSSSIFLALGEGLTF